MTTVIFTPRVAFSTAWVLFRGALGAWFGGSASLTLSLPCTIVHPETP